MYQVFGGLKKKWPTLKTMSTLNEWSTFPSDLPLDILVDNYVDYGKSGSYLTPTDRETMRRGWLASKPKAMYWWYYCMISEDPENSALLNTWVERPSIQGRLMYWLASLHAVNGMLYWGVGAWNGQCPSQRPCKPVGRINHTGLTDFNPATWYAERTIISAISVAVH